MDILDLSGLMCPMPVLKTKKFLSAISSGNVVMIITTDPDSWQDLQDFCNKSGHILVNQIREGMKIISQIKCK